MALNYYLKPETEVLNLNTKNPTMIPFGGDETSGMLTNKHHWEDDQLGEGLDDSPYALTAPSLWEE